MYPIQIPAHTDYGAKGLLGPLVCSDAVLHSETTNPFRHFGRALWGGSAHHKASTYKGQHNTERRRHTSRPRAEFEPTITMFEDSDLTATHFRQNNL